MVSLHHATIQKWSNIASHRILSSNNLISLALANIVAMGLDFVVSLP
jgi:hypothetical protein